jgi:tetratricopeptide (TPR) repeat protein
MDPRELIQAHRYGEALAAYTARLERGGGESRGALEGQSKALLCLGSFERALSGFIRANEREAQKLNGTNQPYLKTIGTIQWILGDRYAAIETLKRAVDGILDGTILYADLAGGVSQGLLTWYFGVSARDRELQDYALGYLTKLSRKSKIRFWPGPVARYILGQIAFDEMVMVGSGAADFKGAIQIAESDLLKRRQVCNAIFYDAVRKRKEGDEKACARGMLQCSQLENPIIEEEWYLARAEVGQQSNGSASKASRS